MQETNSWEFVLYRVRLWVPKMETDDEDVWTWDDHLRMGRVDQGMHRLLDPIHGSKSYMWNILSFAFRNTYR